MADSIRESLTKAFAAAESTPPPSEPVKEPVAKEEAPTPPTAAPEAPTPPAEAKTTPEGSAPPSAPQKGADAPKEGTPAPTTTDPKTSTPGGSVNTPQPPPSPADQAPGSWKANEKAEWDKIPPTARAAIKRREAEASRALTQSTEARRAADEYQKVLYPFEPLMTSRGITDPLHQVIKPILQIRAALEVGTAQQKAALVANMVRDFGIDVSMLDAAIVQNVNSPQPQQTAPQVAPVPPPSLRSNPELQPLFALAEQIEQRRAAKLNEEIEAVESLPHFEELRDDMADIISRADARGRKVSVKQAYDMALAQSEYAPASVTPSAPQVSPSEAAAILARSRKAASSVSGAPSTTPGKKPTTLREQIASAMEIHAS